MNGTTFGTSKGTLSADGKTLTVENEYTSAVDGQPVGKQRETWLVNGVARLSAPALLGGSPLDRLHPKNRRRLAISIVGDQVNVPVQSLAHVPDAAHLRNERFFTHHASALNGQPRQLLAHHATNKEVAAPLRETVSRVHHQAGDADRGHPDLRRLLHAFAVRAFVNRQPRLVERKPR